jgi:mono/diheme cytochrome c family protein
MFRAAACALIFAACATDSSTGIDTSTLTCPPDSTLSYETYGKLVFEQHCLSCHATKEKPRLNTVEEIRANRNAILGAAVGSTRMPASDDMPLQARELLGEWLVCGAP